MENDYTDVEISEQVNLINAFVNMDLSAVMDLLSLLKIFRRAKFHERQKNPLHLVNSTALTNQLET